MFREASSDGILIKGCQGNIFAQGYYPEGEYPAPTVIICHGIPGNERLMDFAVYLREQGFAALHFHYAGSWGSEGNYSMLSCYEDVKSVVNYVKEEKTGLFDKENIFVLGHSMGGLMAAHAIGEIEEVKGGVIIMPLNGIYAVKEALSEKPSTEMMAFYDRKSAWLRNFSWDVMNKEIHQNPEFFDLSLCAKKLSKKPVLCISGKKDALLPKDQHIDLLNNAIESFKENKLKKLCFDTNHAMDFKRQEVKENIAMFLKENI